MDTSAEEGDFRISKKFMAYLGAGCNEASKTTKAVLQKEKYNLAGAIEKRIYISWDQHKWVVKTAYQRIAAWAGRLKYNFNDPNAAVCEVDAWTELSQGQLCVLAMDVTIFFTFTVGLYGVSVKSV